VGLVTALTWKLHENAYRLDFDDAQEAEYHAAWLVAHGRQDVVLFEPGASETEARERIWARLKAQAGA
jgi:hypothetical protein